MTSAELQDVLNRLEVRGLLAAANGGTVHLCDATTLPDRERLALTVLAGCRHTRGLTAWELVRALEQSWLPDGVVTYRGSAQQPDFARANDAFKRVLGRLARAGLVTCRWEGTLRRGRWRWSTV